MSQNNRYSDNNQVVYSEEIFVDEASLKAAQAWLASGCSEEKSIEKLQEINESFKLLRDHSIIVNQRANNVQNRRPAEDVPVRGLDLRAISRYVVFLLMFAQGSSPSKIALYTSLSLVYYAVESGLLHFILQSLAQDDDMEEEERGGADAGNNADNMNNNNNNGAANNPRRRSFAHRLIVLSRDGVPTTLPTSPGISKDVYSFSLAFIMSLSPHWQPAPAPEPMAAANPPLV